MTELGDNTVTVCLSDCDRLWLTRTKCATGTDTDTALTVPALIVPVTD